MSSWDIQNDVIEVVLTSAVADAATFTATYPANRTAGSYARLGHRIDVAGALLTHPADFTISFGASSATITNATGKPIPAGRVLVQLRRSGTKLPAQEVDRARDIAHVLVNLGTPITADADGICASQSGTAATAMTINGALAVGGVVTFDVPRNVVAAWTGTATLTVVGTDEYGVAMRETSGSGTSMTGAKAFKTITSVTPSANITSATVGSGVVLGLPIFLEGTGHVVRELLDGAAATAGTIVAGVTTEASATTGDVRGTYNPNSAPNGSRTFKLVIATEDPSNRGIPQF